MSKKYRYPRKIETMHLDSSENLRFDAIYNFMMEAADANSIELGFDIETLLKKNISWMLLKFRCRVYHYPSKRRNLILETWPSGVESRYAYREFRLYLEGENEPFADGTSSWMVINMKRGRPVKIDDMFTEDWMKRIDRIMEDPALNHKPENEPEFAKTFQVRLADIDILDHVSNPRYVDLLMESVPGELWREKRISELGVEFRRQARYGDEILSEAYREGEADEFFHSLSTNNSQLVRAGTKWDTF